MDERVKLLDDPPGVSIGGHAIALGDLIRYGALLERVISLVKEARHLQPGATLTLGHSKFKLNDADFDWDMGNVTRGKG